MKDLTLTQEYFICAVNDKGKLSSFNVDRLVCLLASGMLELQLSGCISIDGRKEAHPQRIRKERVRNRPSSRRKGVSPSAL